MNRWIVFPVAFFILIAMAVSWIVIIFLPYAPTFPYAEGLLPMYGSRMLTNWAQFDGVHYLIIITHGYDHIGLVQAFFPLYPMLVNLLRFDSYNPILIGMIISIGSLIGSFYCLSLLLTKQLYKKVILLLLLFPTSYFFMSFYTESLFLFLSLAAYTSATKKKWVLAGIFGYLTGLTRFPGFLLFILLLHEAKKQSFPRLSLPALIMPILGLGTYMLYLAINFGDPLLFATVQKDFGTQRAGGTLIPLLTPIVRYFKIIISVNPFSHAFYIAVQEFILSILAFGLSFRLILKKQTLHGIYSLCYLFIPTLTGTLTSMPRYILPLFPIFIITAQTFSHRTFIIALVLSAILLIFNLILFTQGLWVA